MKKKCPNFGTRLRLNASIVILFGGTLGCSGSEQGAESLTDVPNSDTPAALVPTLDEFAASVRTTVHDGESEIDVYALEGDMLVGYETMVDYYESRFLDTVEKAVGVQVVANGPFVHTVARGYPTDRRSTDIRFCFDSNPQWTATARQQAASQMLSAMNDWQQLANVYFRYVSTLDGAGCSQAAVANNSVDFVVQVFTGTSFQGPLPEEVSQIFGFLLPVNTANRPVVVHEVGHVLGLTHEQFHSQSGLSCNFNLGTAPFGPQVTSWSPTDLTAGFDAQSVMRNAFVNCTPTSLAVSTPSQGDGEGIRLLYGPPVAWYVTLFT